MLDPLTIEMLNRESAEEHGWSPTFFGLKEWEFGDMLRLEIANFQASSLGFGEKSSHTPGVVCWATFLRLFDAVALPEMPTPIAPTPDGVLATKTSGVILYKGEKLRVPFEVRQMPIERHYWRCPRRYIDSATKEKMRCNSRRYNNKKYCPKCSTRMNRGRRFKTREEKPKTAVWHWPCTEEVGKTLRCLEAAGLSTHGEINWQGVVYQFVDFEMWCFHAMDANERSLGFDISLSPKRGDEIKPRQKELVKMGRPKRPIAKGFKVGGWKPGNFLYYYDEQLVTIAAMRAVLHVNFGIPLESPFDTGRPDRFGHDQPENVVRHFVGNGGHSDVQNHKWDPCVQDCTPIPSTGKTILELAHEYVKHGW